MAKIKTDDYENLPIEKWNATTYRAYMKHLHEQRFKIPYVANNFAVEGKMITTMRNDYGNEVVKRFVEACFKQYTPTNPAYPGLNFGFMFSYLRERYLPPVLAQIAKEKQIQANTEKAEGTAIDTDWF